MACFADVLYQVLTSIKVDHIFSKSNSISNYEIIRRAAKKTVVGIYKVMYMVHSFEKMTFSQF